MQNGMNCLYLIILDDRNSAVLERASVDSFEANIKSINLSPSNSLNSLDSPAKTPNGSRIRFKTDSAVKMSTSVPFMKRFVEIRKVTVVESIFANLSKTKAIFDLLYTSC